MIINHVNQFQAGTRRQYNVIWTLKQPQNVKTTSIQRPVPAGL